MPGALSKVGSPRGDLNRKSSGHITCSMSQAPHLTLFQEVIGLTGRVGEECGVGTVTSLQCPAVPPIHAPGESSGWPPGAPKAGQPREKAPWRVGTSDPKLTRSAREKKEGCLATESPRRCCESQEGSQVQGGVGSEEQRPRPLLSVPIPVLSPSGFPGNDQT